MKKNAVIGKAKVSNRPNLNAFDLSHRNLFTSYLGAILPVHVMELMPGDTVQVSPNWFTRAMDLQANAYGRLIENVQTFFVPYSSLWKNIQYNMLSTLQKGASGFPESRVAETLSSVVSTSTKLPRMKLGSLLNFCLLIEHMVERICIAFKDNDPTVKLLVPFVTYSQELRSVAIARLASYLGYGGFDIFLNNENRDYDHGGQFTFEVEGVSTTVTLYPLKSNIIELLVNNVESAGFGANVYVNPLRWFAYHFVYNNFYRNDTWQPYEATTCNLDWLNSDNPEVEVISVSKTVSTYHALDAAKNIDELFTAWNNNMNNYRNYMFFDLRESNLPMDAYNGVLPNPQYGSKSSVAPLSAIEHTNVPSGTPLSVFSKSDGNKIYFSVGDVDTDRSGVDIFDLRQSIAMQKFLEISQSHDSSYKEQIKAHFGVDTSDDPYKAYFIGGSSSTMQVDTQVNANLAGDNSAVLGGIASAQGNYSAKYKSDTYGILISLYRIIPILDYQDRGIKDQILTVDSTDLPVPEFDSIGMERRRKVSVRGFDSALTSADTLDALKTYGYAARYLDYKTDVDKIHGEFKYTLKNRVIATPKNLYKSGSGVISSLLRVYPSMVDQIFVNNNHGLLSDDQFYTNMNVSVTAVRPLSVHGMPYAN